MITVDFKDKQFIITCLNTERDLVKPINGLVAKGPQIFYGPYTIPVAVDIASTASQQHWQMTDSAKDAGRVLLQKAVQRVKSKNRIADEERRLGNIDLYPSQIADIDWLVDNGGSGFIFSKTRSGKSNTMYGVLNELNAFPALLVCPPGITFEHARALKEAFPSRTISVLENGMTPAQRQKLINQKADIIVLGYNLLSKHSKLQNYGGLSADVRKKERAAGDYEPKELNTYGFKIVLADEAHALKDPKSRQTRAIKAVAEHTPYRIAATATPTSKKLTNDPVYATQSDVNLSDLWSLLHFVYPESFPARSKFEDKYLHMVTNSAGYRECKGLNAVNEKHFWTMYNPLFLRRDRSVQIKQELRVIPTHLTPKQSKIYKELAKEQLAAVDGELLFTPEAVTTRQRLAQVSYGTPVVLDNSIVELQMPSPQIDAVIEWVNESDEKVVLFTDSVPLFNLLEQQLLDKNIRSLSFPGGLKDADKLAVVERFKNDSDVQVILCSLRAANAGIDFSVASRIGFATLSEDGTLIQQACDRNLGPTQQKETTELAFFVPTGTVVEDMYNNYISKLANVRNAVGD